jgi:hypothetical protein
MPHAMRGVSALPSLASACDILVAHSEGGGPGRQSTSWGHVSKAPGLLGCHQAPIKAEVKLLAGRMRPVSRAGSDVDEQEQSAESAPQLFGALLGLHDRALPAGARCRRGGRARRRLPGAGRLVIRIVGRVPSGLPMSRRRLVASVGFAALTVVASILLGRRLTHSSWPLDHVEPWLGAAALAYLGSFFFRARARHRLLPPDECPGQARCLASVGAAAASGAVLPFPTRLPDQSRGAAQARRHPRGAGRDRPLDRLPGACACSAGAAGCACSAITSRCTRRRAGAGTRSSPGSTSSPAGRPAPSEAPRS